MLNDMHIEIRTTEKYGAEHILKANAAEVVRQLGKQRAPLVITLNGESKVVIMNIMSYKETQETVALLKILALGERKIEEGKVVSAGDTIRRLRNKKARD